VGPLKQSSWKKKETVSHDHTKRGGKKKKNWIPAHFGRKRGMNLQKKKLSTNVVTKQKKTSGWELQKEKRKSHWTPPGQPSEEPRTVCEGEKKRAGFGEKNLS